MFPKPSTLYSAMTIGVTSLSFAAIFIRLADAPPLIIASYRLSIASVAMIAISIVYNLRSKKSRNNPRTSGKPFDKKDFLLLAISSTCLALHFVFWITSLSYTSVTSSVMLVTTNPFIVALASRVIFKESINTHVLAGVGLGIIGGLILTVGDAMEDGKLFGDLLAFLGAIAVVGYLLAGRSLRKNISTLTYATWVYTGAAIILVLASIISGQSFTGFSQGTYIALILLALGPQVLGHSLLNWSLAYATATLVAITVMAEPVIATLLAIPMLNEWPSQTSIIGGISILTGIYIAVRPKR